jgi:hypothetical protein
MIDLTLCARSTRPMQPTGRRENRFRCRNDRHSIESHPSFGFHWTASVKSVQIEFGLLTSPRCESQQTSMPDSIELACLERFALHNIKLRALSEAHGSGLPR